MNRLKKLSEIKFLDINECYGLVSDIIDEEYMDSPQDSRNRNLIAWYLRNRHYLSFRLITDLLNYKGGSSAAEAVYTLEESTKPIPVSMNHSMSIQLDHYSHISTTYYDCQSNVYLDRGIDDDLEDALLHGAYVASGVLDKHNKVSWYKPTPLNSTMYNLLRIVDITNCPMPSEKIVDDIVGTYEITVIHEK